MPCISNTTAVQTKPRTGGSLAGWPALKRIQENHPLSRYFFEHGKGNDLSGARGTLWAAYNGVTELIDHRRMQNAPDRRLDSVWFGDGCRVKGRALRVARAKLQAWTK